MENASKALIIAGAILIAIMIISLGILIFNQMGGFVKNNANLDEQEIAAFNSKITPYLGQSISGSQVNALIQYVISNNLACIQSGETVKAIAIEFPNGEETNTIKVEGNELKGADVKRVETGPGQYYSVSGTYDSNGLLTNITVSAQNKSN